MDPNDKHFKWIRLTTLSEDENVTTLNDNSFADLTFDNFYGYGIKKLSTNSLGKTASTIRFFWCLFCDIKNSPPNYNVWQILSTLTNVNESFQIQNGYCKSNPHKEKLYDPDVESKLKTKCK